MDMVHRSYRLKFNYTETVNFRPGSCLKSPTFSAGGYEWRLFYYRNWKESEDPRLGVPVTFYIFLCTVAKNVNAIFELTFLKNDGSLSTTKTKRVSQIFSNDAFASQDVSGCWVHFFMQRDKIKKYLRDGHIIIMCSVTIMGSNPTSCQEETPFVASHSPALGEHFANLLHDKDMLDVTFEVKGELFQAHKLVVAARSPVLKNLLLGRSPTSNGSDGRIRIDEIQPSVFKMMLHFIYTDSIPENEGLGGSDSTAFITIIQQLLAAADMYALTRLKLMCEEMLCMELSVDTFVSSIVLAEEHNCPRLRDACHFLASNPDNLSKIALTDEFLNLLVEYPSIVRELRDRVSNKPA